MILGCDAAGVDEDGNEVVLHSVIGQTGHGVGPEEPRSILTERYQGTFAEQVAVPDVERPAQAQGALLRGGRLSAHRLADGVPHALHQRGRTARRLRPRPGRRRRCRHRRDRARARRPGCGSSPPAGTRPSASGPWSWAPWRRWSPGRGCRSGWTPSSRPSAPPPGPTRSSRCGPAARLVISGATSGDRPSHAELTRIFFLELKVVGSTMGTKDELEDLLSFCAATGVRPVIDEVLPLDRAREGFERLAVRRPVRQDRAHQLLTRLCLEQRRRVRRRFSGPAVVDVNQG